MIGLAASPGTAVEPTCSIRRATGPSAPAMRACSRLKRAGHAAS